MAQREYRKDTEKVSSKWEEHDRQRDPGRLKGSKALESASRDRSCWEPAASRLEESERGSQEWCLNRRLVCGGV